MFTAIQGLIGFLLLIAGSQLPWLFAGGMIFVAGGLISTFFPGFRPGGDLLPYALVSAVIGILLSIPFKRILVVLAGLLAGIYLSISIPQIFGLPSVQDSWWILLAAGLAGALLVILSFGIGSIILTVTSGAALLAGIISLDFTNPIAIFISAFVIGLAAQVTLAQYAHPTPEPE